MARIYIDMATSVRWRRPPVGIVRVEREFARYCLEHEPDTVFCDIDTAGEYHAMRPNTVRKVLDDSWCRSDSAGEDAQSGEADLLGGAVVPSVDDLFFSIGLLWHHGAIHAYRLARRFGAKVIGCCYDTVPIDYPEYSGTAKQPFAEYLTCLAHTARLIITDSDNSRRDLEIFFERIGFIDVPPLKTVRLACPNTLAPASLDDLTENERATCLRLAAGEKFALYVSTFESRKNHRLLVALWKDLYRERGDACPTLVLVGHMAWGVNDLWAEMQASDVWAAGKIMLLQHVSDALLAQLYRRCAFTLFPSFYEGWGLAATESLAYGKLAIVSSAPALLEATEGICPAIHPLDYLKWRETVTHYFDDADACAEAEARIRSEYRPRRWRDFSADLLAAAREIA
jgi:glycosyltransferase involved in cell wall biosynthesis